MKRIYFSLLLAIVINSAYSQLHDKIWISGAGTTFISTFESDTVTTSYYIDTVVSNTYMGSGSSCISDSLGNLAFYSNGMNVYHREHEFMDGGYHIVPDKIYDKYSGIGAYSQNSILLPIYGNKYFLITPTASDHQMDAWKNATNDDSIFFDLLWYHVIDMSQNNRMGKVIESKIPILENAYLSKPEMMACRHANGTDWWLLKGRYHSVAFHTFLVSAKGIEDYGIQDFPWQGADYDWDLDGQSVFSPDGTQFATVVGHRRSVNLFDFDRCTGKLSNQRVINAPLQKGGNPNDSSEIEFLATVGVAFSPDQKLLYFASKYNILQYELGNTDSASAWYHVANLDTTWQKFQGYTAPYLGPNGRLYIGNWNKIGNAMSVINNPNGKGALCGWCPRCFRFKYDRATNPPCMPNYRLGALAGSPCDTIHPPVPPPPFVLEPISLYPNPVTELLNVKLPSYTKYYELAVYNVLGQVIFKVPKTAPLQTTLQLPVKAWAKGVYEIKIITESTKYRGKFVRE